VSSEVAESSHAKLEFGKVAEGDVVCLRFAGTLDEDFDPRQLPGIGGARAVVLHLAEVRRISSFGIRQWVEFLRLIENQVELIVMVDCSPKVVDQLNMVGNFAGRAIVYSFAAPYHCDFCEHDEDVVLRCDDDWELIKERKLADRECPSCGETSYFDGDAVPYLAFAVSQGKVDLDPGVAKFLATSLGLAVSAASRRLRVEKAIVGRFVSMKLAGDIDEKLPIRTLADSAEGSVVFDVSDVGIIDEDGAERWRQLMAGVAGTTDRVFISGASPAFALKLLAARDIGAKTEVVSISIPYRCDKCEVVASHSIDVDRHYSLLHEGQPPACSCPDCGASSTCIATDEYRLRWRDLPASRSSGEVRKSLRRHERGERRDAKRRTKSKGRPGRFGLGTGFAVAAIAVAGGLAAWRYSGTPGEGRASKAGLALLSSSADRRPSWLPADVLSYGACETGAEGLVCVGASMSSKGRTEARDSAREAGLDALTVFVADRVEDEQWKKAVVDVFAAPRDSVLAQLDAVSTSPQSAEFGSAMRKATDGRRRVATLLRATGGAAVPTFAAEEYWEEYETGGGARRNLVAVKYVVDQNQLTRILDAYTQRHTALGCTVVTMFPALAWSHPEVTHGVLAISVVDGKLAKAGLQEGDIVQDVRDRRVELAADFERILAEEIEDVSEQGGVITFSVVGKGGVRRQIGVLIEATQTQEPRRRRAPKREKIQRPFDDAWSRDRRERDRDDPYR